MRETQQYAGDLDVYRCSCLCNGALYNTDTRRKLGESCSGHCHTNAAKPMLRLPPMRYSRLTALFLFGRTKSLWAEYEVQQMAVFRVPVCKQCCSRRFMSRPTHHELCCTYWPFTASGTLDVKPCGEKSPLSYIVAPKPELA